MLTRQHRMHHNRLVDREQRPVKRPADNMERQRQGLLLAEQQHRLAQLTLKHSLTLSTVALEHRRRPSENVQRYNEINSEQTRSTNSVWTNRSSQLHTLFSLSLLSLLQNYEHKHETWLHFTLTFNSIDKKIEKKNSKLIRSSHFSATLLLFHCFRRCRQSTRQLCPWHRSFSLFRYSISINFLVETIFRCHRKQSQVADFVVLHAAPIEHFRVNLIWQFVLSPDANRQNSIFFLFFYFFLSVIFVPENRSNVNQCLALSKFFRLIAIDSTKLSSAAA